MALGGARKGAGRKAGVANTRSREIAEKAMAEGITPLEVMLKLMRKFYDDKKWDLAGQFARDAAPYVHPRLGSITLGNKPGETFVVEEKPATDPLIAAQRIDGLFKRTDLH